MPTVVGEREHAFEDGPQPDGDRCEEKRSENPARPGRRQNELANEQNDRGRSQDSPNDDHESLLQRDCRISVAADGDQAVAGSRVEEAQRPAAVVEKQDREREHERDPVADLDQRALPTVGDASGRIGEHRLSDDPVASSPTTKKTVKSSASWL